MKDVHLFTFRIWHAHDILWATGESTKVEKFQPLVDFWLGNSKHVMRSAWESFRMVSIKFRHQYTSSSTSMFTGEDQTALTVMVDPTGKCDDLPTLTVDEILNCPNCVFFPHWTE